GDHVGLLAGGTCRVDGRRITGRRGAGLVDAKELIEHGARLIDGGECATILCESAGHPGGDREPDGGAPAAYADDLRSSIGAQHVLTGEVGRNWRQHELEPIEYGCITVADDRA